MTLRSRNFLVRIYLFFVLSCVAGCVWYLLRPGWKRLGGSYLWPLLATSSSVVVSILGSLVLIRLFRRTMSAPVFFVVLALTTYGLSVFKMATLFVGTLFINPVHVTRVLVVSQLMFAFLIFAAGLHAADQTYRRHGWVVFVVVFVALTLSWVLPVDSFILKPNLMFRVALGNSIGIVVGVFLVLGSVSYLQVGIKERDRSVTTAGFSLFVLSAGFELLYYATGPVFALLGSVFGMLGVLLFGVQSYRDQIIG